MSGTKGPRLLHTVFGPLVFAILCLTPLPGMPYPVRASIGLLVWMSWWWIFQPVHLAVTGFLPLPVLAVCNFLPVGEILPAYAQQLVILILGANIIAVAWNRWGLDRRIALVSLLGIGTGTRQQILAWFAIAAVLSTLLPNAVVAAAMIPIVVAMLRYIGIEDLKRSAFGTALLVAVAWGTSVGGSGTPLGGAPNLLTVQFLEEQLTGHEFLFSTWFTHVMPLTLVAGLVAFVYMRFALKPELEHVDGTHEFFRSELAALGPMRAPERWGLALFLIATALAFTRQLYADALPGLTPAFAFLGCGLVCFVLRHADEPLITWEYAQPRIVWGLIYLFAGGSALGQILSRTGTAQYIADWLVPLADHGGIVAIGAFGLLTIVLTQITSNTAAVAIVVPITISTFESMGANAVPMVFIVAAIGNYGLVLPSSSAGPAIAAGYGIELKTMVRSGIGLSLLILAAIVVSGYLLERFWPGFGVA